MSEELIGSPPTRVDWMEDPEKPKDGEQAVPPVETPANAPADSPDAADTMTENPPNDIDDPAQRVANAIAQLGALMSAPGALGMDEMREKVIADQKLGTEQIAVLKDYITLISPPKNGEGKDENEEKEEKRNDDEEDLLDKNLRIRKLRNEARKELTDSYGARERVEGTSGFAWINKSDDSAYVIKTSGYPQQILVGQLHNFGKREAPIWKKWNGRAGGWSDAALTDAPKEKREREPDTPAKKTNGERPDKERKLLERRIKALRDIPSDRRGALTKQLEGIRDPEKLAVFEKYLLEVENKTAPNPDALGVMRRSREAAEYIEKDGHVYVREGKGARTATKEEADLYHILEDGKRMLRGISADTHRARPERPREDEYAAPKMSEMEDRFNSSGALPREGAPPLGELLRRLDERHRPTGPRIPLAPERREPPREPPREPLSHPRPLSWDVDPRNYAGIEVKPIGDILADPKRERMFGILLRSINEDEGAAVLRRYAENALTPNDMDFLTYGTYEFAKWMKEGERIASQIGPEDARMFAERNPDMRNVTAFIGNKRGAELFQELVIETAMKNPRRMRELSATFDRLRAVRGNPVFERLERDVVSQCERLNITREQQRSLVHAETAADRQAAVDKLAKHIHGQAGKARRFLDGLNAAFGTVTPGSSRDIAEREMRRAENFTPGRLSGDPRAWANEELDDALTSVAQHLGNTVATAEVRRMVAEESRTGLRTIRESERGPRSYLQIHNLSNSVYSEDMMRTRIEDHIRRDRDWERKTHGEQEAALSRLKSEEMDKHGKGRGGLGFFAWLLESLVDSRFDTMASTVLKRPVHIR